MKYIFLFLACISFSAQAQACLDITGAYEMNFWGGAACSPGTRVEMAWHSYRQIGCSQVVYKKVHKLVTGEFCETRELIRVADGNEHILEGGENSYRYEIKADRHAITYKNVATGTETQNTRTLDLQGNLTLISSDGTSEVFQKGRIE